MELAGLFLSAFAAAKLVPAQSELVLVALILADDYPVWLLLAQATFGNVLRSTVNWAMGRFLIRFADRRWFPVSQAQMKKAIDWYARWGSVYRICCRRKEPVRHIRSRCSETEPFAGVALCSSQS